MHALPNLPELIAKLPIVPEPAERDFAWAMSVHKNGMGLRVMRSHFQRYPEPCFWRIVKFRPVHVSFAARQPRTTAMATPFAQATQKRVRVWGILTWRGAPRCVLTGHDGGCLS